MKQESPAFRHGECQKEGYLDGVKEGSKAATADFRLFIKKWEYDMQSALAHMEERENADYY